MSVMWLVLALLPILGGAERFNCRGRILGAYYADAKSGCKAFHVCVRVAGGGVRDFRFFCPPGTLFHQEAQTCTDWGDDDPLACPADIYDGQFDLYKIGSGYDTKKLTASSNREEEPEFGLQRAESGDRRTSQNNNGATDLRTAHSSDFFSGQRDQGRDEQPQQKPSSIPPRQSFRRATTPRVTFQPTEYTTASPPPQTPSKSPQYVHKQKLLRKRPIYSSTSAPVTTEQSYYSSPSLYDQSQQYFKARNPAQNRQPQLSTEVNIPPQFKDEYVEVSKVTPKQNTYFPTSPTPTQYTFASQPTSASKTDSQFYNYDGTNSENNISQDSKAFKLRNSFNVQPEVPKQEDFVRIKSNNRGTPGYSSYLTTTVDYNTGKGVFSSTPSYKNINSVQYEPERNNFVSFPGPKQNYYNNPSTTPPTSAHTTVRPVDPYSGLNTVAFNTNYALDTHSSNYANSQEDDGQYRPPQGEDDGQYRPELYERETELLSGAHSLNIAASGNRLPDDQKPRKNYSHNSIGKASTPRPFRVPTSSSPEVTYYSHTDRPSSETTQKSFDYIKTYTTTSRPYDLPSGAGDSFTQNNSTPKISQSILPRSQEPRTQSFEVTTQRLPSSSRPSRPPSFSKPAHKNEDTSYDYAYYDSDPERFSEYGHIEEFDRTQSRA
ncbi:adhesive plaque matrix protein-like isoform X1 [Leptidea sinapis]|uniref:adhesive plaque matrix protein-like isoform X1 n=1 Tax=Leptidea sinapis TaxID=189913 RepID=UPI0021C2A6E2|nr:adhesive plaque matrix protein-like isoform X1 [Leptidea sinapis]